MSSFLLQGFKPRLKNYLPKGRGAYSLANR